MGQAFPAWGRTPPRSPLTPRQNIALTHDIGRLVGNLGVRQNLVYKV